MFAFATRIVFAGPAFGFRAPSAFDHDDFRGALAFAGALIAVASVLAVVRFMAAANRVAMIVQSDIDALGEVRAARAERLAAAYREGEADVGSGTDS